MTVSTGPKIFRIVIRVSDLEKAVRFYSELLGIPGRPLAKFGRAYFDCGSVILAVVVTSDPVFVAQPLDQLYLATSELEQIYARAKGLGCLADGDIGGKSGEIVVRPWGERSFFARDPFGNALCFVDEKTVFTGKP